MYPGLTKKRVCLTLQTVGRLTPKTCLCLSEMPLLDHPGENFNYSVSLDVLGAVIEKVTGLGLAEYLDQAIFDPLGMEDTYFDWTLEMSKKPVLFFVGINGLGLDGNPLRSQ